ncbi:MAG TPA: hypothetical protein VGK74_17905 [Symbiobacteriaceae bacterium]|jgi:phenylacetate-CoA ligase
MRQRGFRPEDIGSLEDLQKLPILTKADIRSHREALVALNMPMKHMVPGRTGGSTGEPLQFYHDGAALSAVRAAKYRALGWWGIELGDPEVMIWGSPIDIKRADTIHGIGTRLLNRRILPAFRLSEESMLTYARMLANWRPKLIYGYASSLTLMGRFLMQNNSTFGDWHPALVVSTTEVLTPQNRELIQQAFRSPVADEYGSREAGILAFQCPHGSMHIAAENLIIETVRGGKPCAQGELGELVVTDLNNKAMPLIRYAIGDVGVLGTRACSCGRNLPVLESLGGRVNDIVVTPDGTLLTGSFFPHFFKDYAFVRQFQVRQPVLNRLEVLLTTYSEPSEAELAQVRVALQRFVTSEMAISFKLVDDIPLTPAGKLRHVLSDVSAEFL